MWRTRAAVAAVVVLAASTLAGPAEASHSWNNYHWARTANPFTLGLGDNVTSAWDEYLRTSSSQWSTPTGGFTDVLDTAVVTGGTTAKRCRATSGRVEVCNAKYGFNGWLGVAGIWVQGGEHITQGYVKLNDSYFSLSAYNTPEERAHVMCQEIGHTFGLGHTSEDGTSQQTCMDYSSDPNSTAPNAHDYEQLATIYKHLDSFTTVGPVTTTSSSDGGPGRSSWGREVHRSEHHSTFVRDLGGGTRLITEVTWAN